MRQILVAVDGSQPAARALALGADLAARYGATLHLVHVVRELTPPMPRGFEEFARVERVDPSLWAEMGRVGEALLDAAQAEARARGVQDVRAEVVTGDPAEELVRYSREHAIDLLVMGRRGLGRIGALLMGSVSAKVSSLAGCPVITVP